MKIDFSQEMLNLDGTPIKQDVDKPGDNKGEAILLRDVACSMLNVVPQGDIDGAEKARRGGLAQRIYTEFVDVKVNIDEAKLLKDVIGKYNTSTRIVFQALKMIEDAAKKNDSEKTKNEAVKTDPVEAK